MNTESTWKVHGTTDEVTTCELCGKIDLRGTVYLTTADGDEIYAGTTCAARKVGTTADRIRDAVKVATRKATLAAREADRIARQAAAEAARAPFRAWLLDTYGTTDELAVKRAKGYRSVRPIAEAYEAHVAAIQTAAVETAEPVWGDTQQLTFAGMAADVEQGALFI